MKNAFRFSLLLLGVLVLMLIGPYAPAGIIPAIIPAAVPTANKIGNSAKFQLGTTGAVSGDCAQFDASLNITGPGTGAGCGAGGTQIHAFGASFGGAGTALTSPITVYTTVPYSCTIQAWNITVDAGTATVDIWKVATGTAIPTVANTITASATPAISTGTAIHSTTLTGWTTSVAANDIFGFNLKVVSTATYVNLAVQCQ